MTTEVFEQSAKPARLEAAHEREATTKPIEGGAQSTTSHNVYYVIIGTAMRRVSLSLCPSNAECNFSYPVLYQPGCRIVVLAWSVVSFGHRHVVDAQKPIRLCAALDLVPTGGDAHCSHRSWVGTASPLAEI